MESLPFTIMSINNGISIETTLLNQYEKSKWVSTSTVHDMLYFQGVRERARASNLLIGCRKGEVVNRLLEK